MPELEILKSSGLEHDKLKALFTSENPSEKLKGLINRIQTRISTGREFCFRHHKHWHALDKLVETPFRQATTAALMDLSLQDATSEKVVEAANSWGLTHLIVERKDPKTGKLQKALNVPTFFQVLFPLSRSLSIVRAAKLTIDRAQTPLLKWEPPHSTPKLRKKCEVITDRGELMTNEWDYRNTMRQAILRTCQHGHALQFIREEWQRETQLGADGKEKTIREGLRFKIPHPSWCYYDLNHPLSSLNSDSGTEYVGYWTVMQYRELRNDTQLWNTNRIVMGDKDWLAGNRLFFALNGCVMKPPVQFTEQWNTLNQEGSVDRWFTQNFDDAGVFMTEHFERLIPEQDGLGSYKYPVWMRFMVAGDNTITYAAPLPHVPTTYWGYDPDDSKMFNVGMALEAAPWELAITNLLTQGLLSVKQNLANLTLVNEDMIDETTRQLITGLGESQYRQTNLIPLSFRKFARMQYKPEDAAHSIQLPRHDVNGIWTAIQTCMQLMERSLGISAQESGAAASHEQTTEEIRMISQSVGVRLDYTSLGIDAAVFAWKKQLYAYLMAYGEYEFYAYVSPDGMSKSEVEAMGFTVDEDGGDKWRIKASKSAIKMEYFSSHRDGQDRANNLAIGTQMIQLLAPLAPKLLEVVEGKEVVMLYNSVLDLMGLPRDWRIKSADTEQSPMAQQQWVIDQMTQMAKRLGELTRKSDEQMAKSVADELQATQKQIQQLAKIVQGATQLASDNKEHLQQVDQELSQLLVAVQQHEHQQIPQPNPEALLGAPPPDAGTAPAIAPMVG